MVASDTLFRLENLWRYLEDEGLYTKANTVFLAIEEIKRLRYLEQLGAHLDAGGKLPQNGLAR